MVPWTDPSPQSKGHLDRFSCFCRAHDRDRPTDHATSVIIGCTYIHSIPMRPNITVVLLVVHAIDSVSALMIHPDSILSGSIFTTFCFNKMSFCYCSFIIIFLNCTMLWYGTLCSSSDSFISWSRIGSRPSDHYFRSVCMPVCLSVCLCRVFLSRLRSDFDQTWTHVTCLGLVLSHRI